MEPRECRVPTSVLHCLLQSWSLQLSLSLHVLAFSGNYPNRQPFPSPRVSQPPFSHHFPVPRILSGNRKYGGLALGHREEKGYRAQFLQVRLMYIVDAADVGSFCVISLKNKSVFFLLYFFLFTFFIAGYVT